MGWTNTPVSKQYSKGYKTFSCSTQRSMNIYPAHKCKNTKMTGPGFGDLNLKFWLFQCLSSLKLMLIYVEHEKFYNIGAGKDSSHVLIWILGHFIVGPSNYTLSRHNMNNLFTNKQLSKNNWIATFQSVTSRR